MDWKKCLAYGTIGTAVLGTGFFIGSVNRMYGSRGTEVEYSAQIRGEEAQLIREDIRFGPDRFWVEWDDRTFPRGDFETDDGSRLVFDSGGYEIIPPQE